MESAQAWARRVAAIDKPMVDCFIAGPYTHADPAVRQYRHDCLTRAYAQIIASRKSGVCCITLTHMPDVFLSQQQQVETLGSDFWTDADVPFMHMARRLVVVMLPGWEESSGTQKEIAYFRHHGKPIEYVSPNAYILGDSPHMPVGMPFVIKREESRSVRQVT